ncbi:hypothetical protein TNCV_3631591 [Trichonephila clavipes]|nr:hypothetical protein TNCV_3631591 [Trichonephila clavipes]
MFGLLLDLFFRRFIYAKDCQEITAKRHHRSVSIFYSWKSQNGRLFSLDAAKPTVPVKGTKRNDGLTGPIASIPRCTISRDDRWNVRMAMMDHHEPCHNRFSLLYIIQCPLVPLDAVCCRVGCPQGFHCFVYP